MCYIAGLSGLRLYCKATIIIMYKRLFNSVKLHQCAIEQVCIILASYLRL